MSYLYFQYSKKRYNIAVMHVQIEPSWKEVLAGEFKKEYFGILVQSVKAAYAKSVVYPPPKLIFNAFTLCPFDSVRVVILGQDPYHAPSQAHGLAFSVQDGVVIPPSLQNIYKEITRDLGSPAPTSGNLTRLASQGVLLLNSTLTVQAGIAGSHQSFGWETFTDAVIQTISNKNEHVVFMLWGAFATSKRQYIDEEKHLVLTTSHPSPLSAYRGFLGSGHFRTCNEYLVSQNKAPIIW